MKSKFISKIINTGRKHLPTILIVTGSVGIGVGTVLACAETLKAKEEVDALNEELNVLDTVAEQKETTYSEEEYKKDILKTYVTHGLKIARIYTPAVVTMGLSMTCIFWSNDIVKKRLIASTAAYATLDTCFKDYRNQIVTKYGEDADVEALHHVKIKKDKDGNKKCIPLDKENNKQYGYSVLYDESSKYWENDPFFNSTFLLSRQEILNQQLPAKGKIYLSDVFHELGIPEEILSDDLKLAARISGWVWKKDSNNNYIKFIDINNPSQKDFIDGLEKRVWLNFNVDGVIWDKMPD